MKYEIWKYDKDMNVGHMKLKNRENIKCQKKKNIWWQEQKETLNIGLEFVCSIRVNMSYEVLPK